MKKNFVIGLQIAATAAALTLLPGCGIVNFFKEKFGKGSTTPDTSAVLVHVEGKPSDVVLTENEFNLHLQNMLQQFRGMVRLENLPAGLKTTLLNRIVQNKRIERWAVQTSVESNPEFQKLLDDATKQVKSYLYLQFFEKDILSKIEAGDKEVMDEYEKNKTKFVKAKGGSTVCGASFANAVDAKAFLAKAKGKSADEFTKLAKAESGATFKDFSLVNEDSFDTPEAIRAAATKAKGTSVEMVSANKASWVIHIADKKEPEYMAFDEVKGKVEMMVRQQKFSDAYNTKVAELEKEFKFDIKKELIEPQASTESATSEPATKESSVATAA